MSEPPTEPTATRRAFPTRARVVRRWRPIVGAAVLMVVLATACADDETSPATPAATLPADSGRELVSPTETDRPFDLTGGAAAPTGEVDIATEDPRGFLDPDVRAATEPWPTDWSRRTIDVGELILGIAVIDPRDRIRPIDTPKFEPIAAATWLDPREPGALVQVDGAVRFYPLSILTRHEIVNDRFGDVPIAVTYCPLCNTAIAFDARVGGQVLRFGVSGLLRNSDLVMWDEQTASLWQQITGEAVVGELAGAQLEVVSTAIVSYGDAVENFPEALSLSRETGVGVRIEYGSNGYVGYSSSDRPFAFRGEIDDRYEPLSRVVGVSVGGADVAFPFGALARDGAVNADVGGVPVAVFWGGDTADALDTARIAEGARIGTGIAFDRRVGGRVLRFSAAGDDRFVDAETGSTWTLLGRAVAGELSGTQLQTVPHRNEFWFAWSSFFPDADVHG